MLVAMVTAPGHARLGDDVGLLLVVAGVEDGEDPLLDAVLAEEGGERRRIGEVALLPAALAQELGEELRLLDRRGADEHRLAALLAVLDEREDRLVLLVRRPVDLVIVVDADHRLVGRHLDDVEPVDVAELLGLGRRRAGHAGELLVHAEVVLEGDRGERLVLGLDLDVLLGLERLVQALRVAPSRHHAAGELVDDDDLVVPDDVVLVALEQPVGAERLLDVMDDGDVLDVVERVALEQAGLGQDALELLVAGLGERGGALLLVDLVVFLVELRG